MTHAGPEIGVASTKAFTAQMVALALLALRLGQARGWLVPERARRLIKELLRLPSLVECMLASEAELDEVAHLVSKARNALFLGRRVHYPIALEGALKLKEITYIHAEGCAAGEMKHGLNALIEEGLPVIVVAGSDPADGNSRICLEKTISNIQEVKARGGTVIAVVGYGDEETPRIADRVIPVPAASELILPVLEIVPLQLLAYKVAVLRGCDVDQPRNLAKSVTVE
jgi:glucosamine--fructose-6-phosphate aminotransferase (isomerizing)